MIKDILSIWNESRRPTGTQYFVPQPDQRVLGYLSQLSNAPLPLHLLLPAVQGLLHLQPLLLDDSCHQGS